MHATSSIPPIHSAPNALPESEPNQQQHQTQQRVNDHNDAPVTAAAPPSTTTTTTTAAASFAARKQWEAKLVSLQRGIEHVQHCRAGDACASSLCHSTRRLMQTYDKHQCPTSAGATTNASASDCKVCKLWDLLMTRRTQMAAIAHLRRPLVRAALPQAHLASSCGMAALAAARRRSAGSTTAATSVFSRVLAAQTEAHHLSARRRY